MSNANFIGAENVEMNTSDTTSFDAFHSPRPSIPATLLSPAIPTGFDTAWSFIARTEPWLFDLMDDPIGGLIADDRKARRLASEVAVTTMTIAAPDALCEAGVEDVIAAPTSGWHDVFPANP